MSFETLGLSKKVLDAVTASGYTEPTPIQAQAIPHVMERRDVLGIAQTGTGKTASFTLPMLSLLEKGRARARMPRTLILEPTRELAAQVEENLVRYGVNHKLTIALLIGGVSFEEQFRKLDRGADILIATPGRLLDHFERGKLLMTGVEVLVIDEADRMLDMGFIPDIERICKMIPFTRQTLFFSATMPPEIERLAGQFLQNPVSVEVSKASSTSDTITQRAVASPSEDYEKRAVLRDLINNADDLKNAIVFCNRKRDVATVCKSLEKHGFSVGALHGDMDQSARTMTLKAFKDNKITILVASDVAARGLDIPDVSHVFNFDVPVNAEDYVHRIGRTGRAGRKGAAFMIVTPDDQKMFESIVELIGQDVEWLHDPVEWDEYGGKRRGRGKGTKGAKPPRSKSAAEKPAADGDGKPATRGRRRKPVGEEAGETAIADVVSLEEAKNEKRRNDRPERKERPERMARDDKSQEKQGRKPRRDRQEPRDTTPFADSDHVPAFLLRSVR